jgi:hypothetical protein
MPLSSMAVPTALKHYQRSAVSVELWKASGTRNYSSHHAERFRFFILLILRQVLFRSMSGS